MTPSVADHGLLYHIYYMYVEVFAPPILKKNFINRFPGSTTYGMQGKLGL